MTILDAPVSVEVDETGDAIALVEKHAAHNYSPLPVVAASAEGAWITDVEADVTWIVCLRTPRSISGTAIPRSSQRRMPNSTP